MYQSPGCTDVLMYTAVLSLLYWCSSPVTTLRQLYLMYSDVHMYIFDVHMYLSRAEPRAGTKHAGVWVPLLPQIRGSPLMADTGAAATAASSAPAESSLVALTGAGSPWGTVRLRPARCLPSRRPFCHLLASGAL